MVAAVAFALSTAAMVVATDVGASDPDLDALTRALQLAELRKAIAEAELATLEARWPSAEVEVAKGDVVVGDKAGYFAEMLAYGGLADAAEKIAARVTSRANEEIVVTSRMNVGRELRLWRLVKDRLDRFEMAFTNLESVMNNYIENGTRGNSQELSSNLTDNGQSMGSNLAIPSSLLGNVAEIASFFRSDVEFKSREVTLNEAALVAEVARRLKCDGWDVVLPNLNPVEPGVLLEKLDTLERLWHEARNHLAGAEGSHFKELELYEKVKEELEKKVQKCEKPSVQTNSTERDKCSKEVDELEAKRILRLQRLQRLQQIKAAFSHLLTGYGEYRTSLTKSTKEAVAPILVLEFADVFRSRERSHRLHVSIATQGAEVLTAKWPWTPGKVSYGGGGAFVFAWIDSDGNLADAGLVGGWQSKTREARRAIESVPWIDREECEDR